MTPDRIAYVREAIARVCHEANRAYCEANGDLSQQPWFAAPEWQRMSAIAGVSFHLANPDATPERSHDEWLRLKRNEGWTYGPEKNVELKQHPCFMPYDGLPLSQRVKDSLFKAVVDALRPLAVVSDQERVLAPPGFAPSSPTAPEQLFTPPAPQ